MALKWNIQIDSFHICRYLFIIVKPWYLRDCESLYLQYYNVFLKDVRLFYTLTLLTFLTIFLPQVAGDICHVTHADTCGQCSSRSACPSIQSNKRVTLSGGSRYNPILQIYKPYSSQIHTDWHWPVATLSANCIVLERRRLRAPYNFIYVCINCS